MWAFRRVLGVLLCYCVSGQAATLRVPSEYSTINAGLDQAALGDTRKVVLLR
jgi:hypothetical protein